MSLIKILEIGCDFPGCPETVSLRGQFVTHADAFDRARSKGWVAHRDEACCPDHKGHWGYDDDTKAAAKL